MNTTIELFTQVRQAATLSEKISLLKAHRSDFVDLIVADAMDESITYGITSKGIEIQKTRESRSWLGGWYDGFHAILEKLASRDLTGNAAIERVTDYLKDWDEGTQRFLLQVLDRDLNLGIGWGTYRSEVLGLADQFEVALAQHLEKAKGVNPVDGQWFASRKCDGCVSGDALVACEGGAIIPIKDIVDRRMAVRVKSWDEAKERVVYRPVIDFMHNVSDKDPAQKKWFSLKLADGKSLRITGNDRVFVRGKGWTRVDALSPGDAVFVGGADSD